jgi:ketosteroid isomerase-like protein
MPVEDGLRTVRRLYRAFESGDHDELRRCLAEDLRWRQAGQAVPAAGTEFIGADALVERVVRPLERDWDGFSEEIDRLIFADGHVVATGTYRGVYRATGRELVAEFCHLWTLENDRITAFRQFTDTAAFAAAMEEVPGRVR